MTAVYYRDVLLKRWRLIVLCALLAAVGTALGGFLIPARYQSTVTLQLIAPSTNLSLLAGADRILQTEATLATSDPVLAQVATRYPGLTTDQLKKEVAAQTIDNTDLFQITVSDHDAGRAAQLANDLATVLTKQYAASIVAANAKAQQPLLTSIASTKDQINAVQAQLTSAQSQKPADPQQVQALQSQLNSLQAQYQQELQTLASIQSTEAKKSSSLRVAQPAQQGVNSSQLRLLLMGTPAALCFGLLLGASFVLLRGWLDQRVRTVPALIETLGWPVLAEISGRAPEGSGERPDRKAAPPTALYQRLDEHLAFLGINTPLFSLMITGALPGETANVVASDLATFLAGEEKRVLLVDANFSHPSQSRLFDIPAEPGLGAAILACNKSHDLPSLHPYLYDAKDASHLLKILPAGPIPPNPEAVLRSRAMQEIIGRWGDSGADMVVLVGPSVSRSAAACALAAQVDGVIVVVDTPRITKDKLVRIKTRLAEHGARVLGCVVSSEPLNQLGDSQPTPNHPAPEQHSAQESLDTMGSSIGERFS